MVLIQAGDAGAVDLLAQMFLAQIKQAREAARLRKGWIMDTYLLRRTGY